MERLLQYLDDLDDFCGIIGLSSERLRRLSYTLLSYLLLGSGAVAGAWLAVLRPPLALAVSTLLFVTLLFRSVTAPAASWSHTA